jgi:VIT1/CCC1 family predicted Fe2+/Mn2+ transporter
MKEETMKRIIRYQRNEITEHVLYGILAKRIRGSNRKILEKISADELKHYHFFGKITGRDMRPNRLKIYFYTVVSAIFGITFTMKMMSNGEDQAEHNYEEVEESVPGITRIIREEVKHEEALISQVEEGIITHMGSMVLAINNSIQEITGIVVGLTFALSSSIMVGKTALISGMAATLAMVASEYLSQKAEAGEGSDPLKAALYTGMVYVFVVAAIVSPYFIFNNIYASLAVALAAVVVIISAFTFFMSVVKGLRYRKALLEVSTITAGVIVLSLFLGLAIKLIFG